MNTKGKQKKYSFKGKVWKYKGLAGWHFVTLPRRLSKTIRKIHGLSEEGWGRLKANASVGRCKWQTAIWYDTKAISYVLPIKAFIRKTERLGAGSSITVVLRLQVEDSKFKVLSMLFAEKGVSPVKTLKKRGNKL